jgi:hypothetical protein
MLKLIRLAGKLLGLVILVTGSFWFGACGDPSCNQCAQANFDCTNLCASTEGDPTECAEYCAKARDACNQNCSRLAE